MKLYTGAWSAPIGAVATLFVNGDFHSRIEPEGLDAAVRGTGALCP